MITASAIQKSFVWHVNASPEKMSHACAQAQAPAAFFVERIYAYTPVSRFASGMLAAL